MTGVRHWPSGTSSAQPTLPRQLKRLVLMCVAASTLATGCSDVSFIERVVIENNTVYAARVEVRGR